MFAADARSSASVDSAGPYHGVSARRKPFGPLKWGPDASGVEALCQAGEELNIVVRLGETVEQQLDAFVRADG